jgi:hypothetical protein
MNTVTNRKHDRKENKNIAKYSFALPTENEHVSQLVRLADDIKATGPAALGKN